MAPALDRRLFLFGTAAAGLSLVAPDVEAAWAPAKRYRFDTPGSAIDTGGAVLVVPAPLKHVLKVVQDFNHYVDILPRLKKSRIVGKKKGRTDVYMAVPILHGTYKLWGVARFERPATYKGDGKIVRCKMVKGNIDSWHGAWKLQPQGANKTLLRMEMFADPDVPIPDSWVTPELMKSAGKAVTRVRNMAHLAQKAIRKG
jgi:ribosome-associated toxin RatA of RatAB toxin-antitoxin module